MKVLTPLFSEMHKLLEQGQSKAEDAFASLQSHLSHTQFKEPLSQIESLMDEFNYEEAGKVLIDLSLALSIPTKY